MLFSSITFIYYYLPAVLFLYFISPSKLKNTVLLISSLVFYAWGEPKYVVVMLLSILSGYSLGLLIEKFENTKLSKIFLILSIILSLTTLVYFKYSNFFITNTNNIFKSNFSTLKTSLPIGISFYTFQIISYSVDIYRKQAMAQKNIIKFATYISFFPQLIAGPIVRYVDIEHDLKLRKISLDKLYNGAFRFIMGLSKKILIANQLGELCNIFRDSNEKSVLFYWIYAIGFTLHIYFDFSGYSDMAIGLGKIFGFEFLENFDFPLISKSITEFWRRWHISLGAWFRDYVYIPMGGNRVSKIRWTINIIIVWMLTGFWHGASWNFIIWGLFFALLLLFEKLWLIKKFKKISRLISHIYVLFFIIISFTIFNAQSLSQALNDIFSLFGGYNVPLLTKESLYYLKSYSLIIIIAIVFSTPVLRIIINKMCKNLKAKKLINIAEPIVLTMLLLVCTAYLVDGSFNPFLYFRF